MSPRWNWDFEDERRARRAARSAATRQDAAAQARRLRIRRRRGVAAVALLGVIALALGGLLGAGHGRAKSLRHAGEGARVLLRRPRSRAVESPTAVVSAVLAYTPFVKEGGDRGHDIALTFDDGPGPYTPQVLSVLEHFHVHATFFAIGQMLRYFSASTVRELRDGDAVGDHTETHPEMATLSAHDQYEELFEQIARIEILGGPRPDLFRPPYGSFNATTLRELRKLHLLMVLWSVDTEDYLQPGVSVIVERALAGAHPGAIILMHDAGGTRTQTIAALPTIIRTLQARGYRLVTVPELLREDPPPPGQPVPSSLRGD
jgi:peptidoglycan/xylan/chitin deacetylase (PgdA/CDA1 family)